MGWFLLRHLQRVYREFDGDFLLALLLGEIAHHNLCHYYSFGRRKHNASDIDYEDWDTLKKLESCNAYSLGNATGIPRETIRRKASELVKRGWITRDAKGGFVLVPGVTQHFAMRFNLQSLVDLLETADTIHALLAGDVPGGHGSRRGGDRSPHLDRTAKTRRRRAR